LLLNLGLLSRHSHTADQYLFAIPNAGPVVKSIIAGRKVSSTVNSVRNTELSWPCTARMTPSPQQMRRLKAL
jgi:hypothetical protein